MKTEQSELIGKKVYKTSRYGIDSCFGVIERVTTTTAIVRQHKFRLANFSLIGDSDWTIYDYELETPELNEKWEKKQLIEKIKLLLSKYNCEDKLSLENVRQAFECLTPNHIFEIEKL